MKYYVTRKHDSCNAKYMIDGQKLMVCLTLFVKNIYLFIRAYEVWGSPEALSREIWNRKKAYEESERYRKGIVCVHLYCRVH